MTETRDLFSFGTESEGGEGMDRRWFRNGTEIRLEDEGPRDPMEAALKTARGTLRSVINDFENAFARLGRDAEKMQSTWPRQRSARWVLLDHFQVERFTYVLARECEPPAGLSALTTAERKIVDHLIRGMSTKEAAYVMGISATTARVLIMRAARRCRVVGREALLKLARHLRRGSKP